MQLLLTPGSLGNISLPEGKRLIGGTERYRGRCWFFNIDQIPWLGHDVLVFKVTSLVCLDLWYVFDFGFASESRARLSRKSVWCLLMLNSPLHTSAPGSGGQRWGSCTRILDLCLSPPCFVDWKKRASSRASAAKQRPRPFRPSKELRSWHRRCSKWRPSMTELVGGGERLEPGPWLTSPAHALLWNDIRNTCNLWLAEGSRC